MSLAGELLALLLLLLLCHVQIISLHMSPTSSSSSSCCLCYYLSLRSESLCRDASVCVSGSSLPHVPLNAFINASPWPNSQHLFPPHSPLPAIYMHTSFCIHDVLLELKVMLPRQGSLGPLMAYAAAYGTRSPTPPLFLPLCCLCLLVPECQRRKTKAMSDSSGNNRA